MQRQKERRGKKETGGERETERKRDRERGAPSINKIMSKQFKFEQSVDRDPSQYHHDDACFDFPPGFRCIVVVATRR